MAHAIRPVAPATCHAALEILSAISGIPHHETADLFADPAHNDCLETELKHLLRLPFPEGEALYSVWSNGAQRFVQPFNSAHFLGDDAMGDTPVAVLTVGLVAYRALVAA